MAVFEWLRGLFRSAKVNIARGKEDIHTRFDQDTICEIIFISKRELFVPLKYLNLDGQKAFGSVRDQSKMTQCSGYGGWLPIFQPSTEQAYQERYFTDHQNRRLEQLVQARSLIEQPLLSGQELKDILQRTKKVLEIVKDSTYQRREDELFKLIAEWHLGVRLAPLTGMHLKSLFENGCESFTDLLYIDDESLLSLKGIGPEKLKNIKERLLEVQL